MGDPVLLKIMGYKGKHKNQDHWERTVYKFGMEAIHWYASLKVSPVDRDGEVKIVHHNLVVPISTDIEASGNEGD